jgi:L-xylulokinase
MNNRYYLGLDNGGSVTKVGLYDQNGNEMATASALSEPIMRKLGYIERDSEKLFEINIKCIKEVIQKSGVNPKDIRAIAITGHGNGLYLVGHDGKPSNNGVISTDTRAAQLVQTWYKDGTFEKMLPKTSQQIWAGQLGPILSWFRHNEKEVLDKSKYAFTCTDYIRYRLTNEAYGEITNMSVVSLMNVTTKDYDDEILEMMGLTEYKHLLPPIRLSHDVCGTVTKEIADLTGLIAGTPVAGGCVDVAACMISTGVIKEDQLSIIAGTWSMNSYISPQQVIDKNLFMCSIHPIENHFLVLEGSMTSASNLEWFVQNFLHEEKIIMEAQGKNVYKACDEMVAKTSPYDPPIVFLPYLFGTNVNADAKACFIGLNCIHEKKDIIRAIFEGVVFSAMMHIENLLRYKNDKTITARISGGIANSKEWVQMHADMLQLPIEVAASKELGTMGTAMCGAIAVGDFASYEEVVNNFIKIKYVCKPNAENEAIYREKYELYKKTVRNMDSLWQDWIKQ